MIFPNGVTDHPINKSGKQKLLVSVWDFKAVPSQNERSYYLCNDHPAKMRPCLARAILQIYGESPVLDPMAGVGTTLVEAMLLGMNAIGVEYEKKFVDQANKNIEHARKLFSDRKLGKAVCVKGDARNLSCLNNPKINSILFSPPYSEMGHPAGKNASKNYLWRLKLQKKMTEAWSEGSISKLSYGSIVFSPPYFNSVKPGNEGMLKPEKLKSLRKQCPDEYRKLRLESGYSRSRGNIGNIPHFGSILFSPPYFDALSTTKSHHKSKFALKKNLPTHYSTDGGNIGNIPEFGSIIFSPPLGEANKGSGIAKEGYKGVYGRDEKLKERCDRPISKDKNNLSNVRFGRTYLGEMFKVYRECFRVLKPGGFMVVVVKDIQRNWETIPLGADTIKLCQLAGFEVHDIIINKLYFPSFWMLNLAKKSQREENKGTEKFHVLKTHEYVLVFKKPK